jgi:23S rRNA pseudouridine1911/1915/1917 synthase
VNALLYHLDRLSGIGGEERPGLIHRLDKDTSGLLLVAKHDWAHHHLAAALQTRRIRRIYQAVAWGTWAQTSLTIKANIGRDPKHRKKFSVLSHGGKTASTTITMLKQNTWCSWIECRLETGRTHQIRVHCHYLGHPLVGDRLYGKHGELAALTRRGLNRPDRQLLHACRLHFIHPRTKKMMEFTAPLPSDFQFFLHSTGLG